MSAGRSNLVRWGGRAALCLALGLVTTVAVAWALAAWLPHAHLWSAKSYIGAPLNTEVRGVDTFEWGRIGMRRRLWRAEVWGALYGPLAWPTRREPPESYDPGSGPRWGAPLQLNRRESGTGSNSGEDARGWPALALWCGLRHELTAARSWEWRASGGILLRGAASRDVLSVRVLPAYPIWPGLLANTGVYALAWAGLLTLAAWARRVNRRRRGRCMECAYELRGLAAGAPCPECGATVPA